jgi:hypothetical protein
MAGRPWITMVIRSCTPCLGQGSVILRLEGDPNYQPSVPAAPLGVLPDGRILYAVSPSSSAQAHILPDERRLALGEAAGSDVEVEILADGVLLVTVQP